ncbi:MAG: ABC transporter permease [Candidatus Ventricola sp.]
MQKSGPDKPQESKGMLSLVKRIMAHREATLVLMILAMFVVIPFFKPTFATSQNVISTLMSVAIKGIIGISITMVLITGGLDLSVGALVAMVCAVFGKVYLTTMNIWVAMLAALAIGLIGGMVNGLLVTRCKLSPFIATLATMGIYRGVTYVLTKGTPIKLTALPQAYKNLGSGKIMGVVPYVVVLFIVLTLIAHFLMKKSKALRLNVYTGSNEKAARFSGINTKKVIFLTYVVIGLFCWLAALLSVGRFMTASPTYGTGWETELIAAAVIGGATLTGGEGSIIGTALGLILLGFVNSAIVIFGVSVYWQDLISNAILLLAVLLDVVVETRKRRKA